MNIYLDSSNLTTDSQSLAEQRGPRILWVDDHIESYDSYVEALREHGAEVIPLALPEQAVDTVTHQHFDAILLDVKMRISGLDLLGDLKAIQPNANFALISSFFYIRDYVERLAASQVALSLDKNLLPDPGAADMYEKFVLPILNLSRLDSRIVPSSVGQTIGADSAFVAARDPFQISISDYKKMGMGDRLRLLELAKNQLGPSLGALFNSGNVWVLFCGQSSTPVLAVDEFSKVPSNSEIMKRAMEIGFAPYHFSAPVDVDEITTDSRWGSSCTGTDGLRNYPTVDLEFEVKSQPYKYSAHFDTGSPLTFFSCEELANVGLVDLSEVSPGTGTCNKGDYLYTSISLPGLLRDQVKAAGLVRAVDLQGHAVLDWDRSVFSRLCGPQCKNAKSTIGQIIDGRPVCKYRIGLVGRNLLIDNKLTIILDGKTLQTRLN